MRIYVQSDSILEMLSSDRRFELQHLQEYADRLGIFVKVKYTGITYSEGYNNLVSLNAGITFKFGKKIDWRPPVIEVPETTPYYEKR